MACRKGESRDEAKARNDAAASVAVGDALLFTMMCIIGMPVDVHAKDGSIYSGIFHTASVDENYAIVLKKATMVKKGNLDANVVNGNLIETLIVRSEDLVQVVAKGVLLPSSGITGYVGEDGIEAAAGYNECLHRDTEVVKPIKSRGNKKHKSQSRLSVKRDNNSPYSSTAKAENPLGSYSEDHIERLDAMNIVKISEAHNVSIDGRQARGDSEEIQSDWQNNLEIQDEGTSDEVHGSSLSNDTMHQERQGVSSGYSYALEDLDQERSTSDETACTVATPPNVSVASTPTAESSLSASSNPYLLVPPKSSSVKGTAKESKLNPGAKMFSPSLHHRMVTPPAVPNGASDSYTPATYTMASMATAQEEVDGSCFARSSVPVKFVPYNNVAFGRGGNDPSYVQPIIGQVVNRTQPVRYTGQYQNFQTGHNYVHPNPQNVMVGRVGPLVCMHPISNDVVQSVAGFSPAATRPVFSPHQVHLPKHQGNGSGQAVQMCMNPPIGAPPFVMPSSIPISQPVFPVLRPIAIPGTNGFLSTKFA